MDLPARFQYGNFDLKNTMNHFLKVPLPIMRPNPDLVIRVPIYTLIMGCIFLHVGGSITGGGGGGWAYKRKFTIYHVLKVSARGFQI